MPTFVVDGKKGKSPGFDNSKARVLRASPPEAARIILQMDWRQAQDLILEHPDSGAVMAALPEQDAYLLIKQIGEVDALDLMELATNEQVQAIFDFDCWEKDQLDDRHSQHWLTILMELPDDIFLSRLKGLDLSLLVLFLKRHMRIIRFEEIVDEVPDLGPDTFLTPDRHHLICYLGDETAVKFIHAITQRVYRLEVDFYYYLLEAVYWEAIPELEEAAYQDRTRRMEDRGFPDYYSAIEIFAPVNPDRFRPGRKVEPTQDASGPGEEAQTHFLQPSLWEDTFFHRLLTRDFSGRDRVMGEAMAVANMVMVAERVSFSELEEVREMMKATDGYLSIGLEFLCDGKEEKGVETLRELRLLDIYKLGRSMATRLGRSAKKLLVKASLDEKSPNLILLDSPHREFLSALLRREPRAMDKGEEKRFSSLKEVEAAAIRFDQLRRLVDLLHDRCSLTPSLLRSLPLLGLNHEGAESIAYKTLFVTAYANNLLGRPFLPKPLTTLDLPELRGHFALDKDGRMGLADQARKDFVAWLDGQDASDLHPFFEEFFFDLAGELSVVSEMRFTDVRYIPSLLLEIPY